MKHVVLALVSLAASAAATTANAPTPGQQLSCSPVADIYSASSAQLQACGLSQIPLTSTSALPGGGSAYNYTLSDGQTYSIVQPPTGFNPITASASEDSAYGIPPAPSPQSPGYSAWEQLTDGNYASIPQHPYLIVGQPLSQSQTSATTGTSTNANIDNLTWAGHSNGATSWKEVQVSYTEPTLGPTGCNNPQVSFWAGIGNPLKPWKTTGRDFCGENVS